MEIDGTFLDYVRHATLTRLQNRISTVKTLTDKNDQSYTFYSAACGLVTVVDDYKTWTMTAPDVMFIFKDLSSMTVGGFLTLLADYLVDNPVFCWEEIIPTMTSDGGVSTINAAISGSVSLATGQGTYAGTAEALAAPDSFADVAAWLRTVCTGSAANVPMSELAQTGSGRVYRLKLQGGGGTVQFDFLFPAYQAVALPWYNKVLDEGFATLGEALEDADSGDIIYLTGDYTLTATDADEEGGTDVTIPAGVTVIVPSTGNMNDSSTGNNAFGRLMGGAAYATLTVASGMTLIVKGTLIVAGNQHSWYVDASCQSRNYGAVIIETGGWIVVEGSCFARGNVYGNGSMTVEEGGTLYQPMQIRDWRGGTGTRAAYEGGVWPFNLFSLAGCRCQMTIISGAELYGQIFLYAGGAAMSQNCLVVGDGGLYELASGSIVITPSGQSAIWRITGACSIQDFSFTIRYSLYTYIVKSAYADFPIWNTQILVDTGATLNIASELKFLPGSSLIVKGTLNVSKLAELLFYRRNEYLTDYFHHYDYDPDLSNTDAFLAVDGGAINIEKVTTGSTALTMTQSSTSGNYSWTIGANTAKVTGNRKSSSSAGFSQTLTMTATDDGYVSFDYTFPNDITLTINGASMTAAGHYRRKRRAGDSITVRVTFSKSSGSSRTVTLSNILLSLAAEGVIGSSDSELRNLPASFSASGETQSVLEYAQNTSFSYSTMYLAHDGS